MDSLGFLFKDLNNIQECIKWHEKAGENGLAGSLKLVGEYLLVGKYIQQDHEKAYKYLRQAFLESDFWALVTLYEYNKFIKMA